MTLPPEQGRGKAEGVPHTPVHRHAGPKSPLTTEAEPTGAIDHQRRATAFHRRAQRAEADRDREAWGHRYWKDAWGLSLKREGNLIRTLNIERSELAHLRRLQPDPLARIIELGRLFP